MEGFHLFTSLSRMGVASSTTIALLTMAATQIGCWTRPEISKMKIGSPLRIGDTGKKDFEDIPGIRI